MKQLQVDIPVSDFIRECVDVPRFAECCRVCPNYGLVWSCPPYEFSPLELWEKYTTLRLNYRKITVPEELRGQTFDNEELNSLSKSLLSKEKRLMFEEMITLEKQIPNCMALSAGCCDLCPSGCSRAEGHPCRNPELMRYSVESLGGNVSKALALYFNEHILWAHKGQLPEYFILMSGLLMGCKTDESK